MFTIILENGAPIYGDLIDSAVKECPNAYMSSCSNHVIAEHLRMLSNTHGFLFIYAEDSDKNIKEYRNKMISINPAKIVTMY